MAVEFRFKAFAWHLVASLAALTLILGTLYLGWYRWPGWYLADASHGVLVMAGVDLVIGPLLTFVIAAPSKARRVLVRDLAIIAAVQLFALVYGATSLWNGRPLLYAFFRKRSAARAGLRHRSRRVAAGPATKRAADSSLV